MRPLCNGLLTKSAYRRFGSGRQGVGSCDGANDAFSREETAVPGRWLDIPNPTVPRTEPAMPRPTAARLVYGSATVVLSTLAMLLLSQTRSGMGTVVIAFVGLALGLLVALTVPLPREVRRTDRSSRTAACAPPVFPARSEASVPRPRVEASSGSRVEEPSLHR
jgi:hypothetical protein